MRYIETELFFSLCFTRPISLSGLGKVVTDKERYLASEFCLMKHFFQMP